MVSTVAHKGHTLSLPGCRFYFVASKLSHKINTLINHRLVNSSFTRALRDRKRLQPTCSSAIGKRRKCTHNKRIYSEKYTEKSGCNDANFVNMAAIFFYKVEQRGSDNLEATMWKRHIGSDNVEATTWKRQCGSDNVEATTWKRQLGSDNLEATTWKRQLGSDNLEATTWKRQLGSDNLEATTWN